MYRLNMSKGAYRLWFWIHSRYQVGDTLRSGTKGWTTLAKVELEYSQPMVSVLSKELERNGLIKRTSSGFQLVRSLDGSI